MSLQIIKAGVFDSVQDGGRWGHQSQGINPGGAMDLFSYHLANCLLGKHSNTAVIEMHYPTSEILFSKETVICLTGADFHPVINDVSIPLHQPVAVNANTILQCKKWKNGTRCYLSLLQDLNLPKWLGSYSTNITAGAGGYKGRALQRGDTIDFPHENNIANFLQGNEYRILPFKANGCTHLLRETIDVIKGNEWDWLTEESRQQFLNGSFTITKAADRMGYRLQGETLHTQTSQQLISSAVSRGTVQLLPNGQLILLLADHQTTGGYPRIAHAVSSRLSFVAQMKPNDQFRFIFTDPETAEQEQMEEHRYLSGIQWAASEAINRLLI